MFDNLFSHFGPVGASASLLLLLLPVLVVAASQVGLLAAAEGCWRRYTR